MLTASTDLTPSQRVLRVCLRLRSEGTQATIAAIRRHLPDLDGSTLIPIRAGLVRDGYITNRDIRSRASCCPQTRVRPALSPEAEAEIRAMQAAAQAEYEAGVAARTEAEYRAKVERQERRAGIRPWHLPCSRDGRTGFTRLV